MTARCANTGPAEIGTPERTLRIGLARFGAGSIATGLRPIVQNLTEEGLFRIRENGRAVPWLAEAASVSPDGLTVRIQLRPGSKFHDGSSVSAHVVATALWESLPKFLGPAFSDIDYIVPAREDVVEVKFRRGSLLLQEALDIPIRKPGAPEISTGPFLRTKPDAIDELQANANYYLGPPAISRIRLTNYATVRAAWADMLRNKVDMLYEVSPEARGFVKESKDVSVFSFTRPYQYMVVLNVRSPQLRSSALRRAMNLAIDRTSVVRDAFDGDALPSLGPVWPSHWAFTDNIQKLTFNPQEADRILTSARSGIGGRAFKFTCLVPTDYERIALVVKRQLEAVGVVMDLKETSTQGAVEALGTENFEAVLLDLVEGFGLFRTYQVWYSSNFFGFALGSPAMDAALDQLRYAASDDEYRRAVGAFQQFAVNDPPAIFLAWGQRTRAVNRRFDVAAEPGRDILPTLRLWRPVAGERLASRN